MITVDQAHCAGCAMCLTACPEDAIECPGMAAINPELYTECLECLAFCPTDAIIHRNSAKERDKRSAIAKLMEHHAKTKSRYSGDRIRNGGNDRGGDTGEEWL